MAAITVLIPAHNAVNTLAQTLDSLVGQTASNFDVLIVDDASSDGTASVAAGYQKRLKLEVLSLPKNLGVAGALNEGLSHIKSPYIARIDADDLAMPTRLEKQWGFLETHPDIDVCSTWMELFFDPPLRPNQILAKPESSAAIKTALIQYCALSHPSTLIRRTFFEDVGNYDVKFDFAEDYDLWCRGALLGKNYFNLPEALTLYRQHAAQVGQQKRQLQYERDLMIKRKYISALLGGESAGHLPEFFSLLTAFTTQAVAIQVIEQSMPLILKLASRVSDAKTFSDIVSGCVGRHLRSSAP